MGEKDEVYILSYSISVDVMVCNSLELTEMQTQALNLQEERFTLWIGPPRRTTMVCYTTRGHIGVGGPCCCPRS